MSSPPPAGKECRVSGLLVRHTLLVRPAHPLFRPIIADQTAFPLRSWVSPLAQDDRRTELLPYIKSADQFLGGNQNIGPSRLQAVGKRSKVDF